MSNTYVLSLVIGAAMIGAAVAQQVPANPNAPSNPAVTLPAPSGAAPVTAAPAAGANSFTELQARTRLENQGFTGVTGLTKDTDGIWRGMGMKAGRSMSVSVDYQGNIVEK